MSRIAVEIRSEKEWEEAQRIAVEKGFLWDKDRPKEIRSMPMPGYTIYLGVPGIGGLNGFEGGKLLGYASQRGTYVSEGYKIMTFQEWRGPRLIQKTFWEEESK